MQGGGALSGAGDHASAEARRTLRSLQCGRGIAALMVVMYHTSVMFRLPAYWNVNPFGDLPRFLDSGVDFFFVLSGYIIWDAHAKDIGSPSRFWNFAWRRLARIYPLYWIIFLSVLPPFLIINPQTEVYRVACEFLLLPANHGIPDQKIVTVSWTLCYEMVFYTVFALALLNRVLGTLIAGVWVLASLCSVAQNDPNQWTVLWSPFTLLFFMGIAICQFLKSRRVGLPLMVVFSAGIIVFAVAAINRVRPFGLPNGVEHWVYGLGAGAMIIAGVEAEHRGSLNFPDALKTLGDASYSLYLVHFAVLSVMAKLIFKTPMFAHLPLQIIFGVMVIVAVAAGVVLHRYVEKPMLQLFQQRRKARAQLRIRA
jgi:exopolysaccharide production protein ExoZ